VDFGGKTFSQEDFKAIEDKMLELARQKNEYTRKPVSKADAIAYFKEKGDEYKLDLLEGLGRWQHYFLYPR
jgi:threonyl-tRNA synthetase